MDGHPASYTVLQRRPGRPGVRTAAGEGCAWMRLPVPRQAGARGGAIAGGRADAAPGGLSSMALLPLLRRREVADQTTVHGFRNTFRDWVAECTVARRRCPRAPLRTPSGAKWAHPPALRSVGEAAGFPLTDPRPAMSRNSTTIREIDALIDERTKKPLVPVVRQRDWRLARIASGTHFAMLTPKRRSGTAALSPSCVPRPRGSRGGEPGLWRRFGQQGRSGEFLGAEAWE